MKKIMSRQKLDTLIDLYRELNNTEYSARNVERVIQEGIDVAQAIEGDCGLNWNMICDFVWSVVRGLKKGATNKDIYQALEVLGWEVQDEA